MMNPKAEHMLKASLETLHFETQEWISEYGFYLDELRILEILLGRRTRQNDVEKQVHIDIEVNLKKMLDRIANGSLKELQDHEKYLNGLLSANGGATEEGYRKKHRIITKHMVHLKEAVIGLKGHVFSYLEQKEFGTRHGF